MMMLSDFALYVAVLAAIGPVARSRSPSIQHQLPAQAGTLRPHCGG
jgi:hypothetical protein